jgi:hypothetical protein
VFAPASEETSFDGGAGDASGWWKERRLHIDQMAGTMVTKPPVFALIYSAAFVLILSAAQHASGFLCTRIRDTLDVCGT